MRVETDKQRWPVRRSLYLFLVVIVMVAIFFFSSMQGNESSAMSGRVAEWLTRVIYPDFSAMSAEQKKGALQLMGYVVRKCAHFTEYALLGASLVLLLSTFSFKYRSWIALLLTALYAVSDEWHQGFVEGRAPMARDVLIDTAGAAFGIIVVMLLIAARRKERKGE